LHPHEDYQILDQKVAGIAPQKLQKLSEGPVLEDASVKVEIHK
jgi:hypothetical protein